MTARTLLSLVVWVALFRRVTPGVVLSGLTVGALASWLVPSHAAPPLRLLPLTRLVAVTAAATVRGTVEVAAAVIVPGRTPQPATVDVRLPGASSRELAWVSAATTLTPGTFVVDVLTPAGVRVHALHADRAPAIVDEVVALHNLVREVLGSAASPAPDTPPSAPPPTTEDLEEAQA